jgi:hypothetical protein
MPLDWDRPKLTNGATSCALCGKKAEAVVGMQARTLSVPTRSLGSRSRKLCRQHAEEFYDAMEVQLFNAVTKS